MESQVKSRRRGALPRPQIAFQFWAQHLRIYIQLTGVSRSLSPLPSSSLSQSRWSFPVCNFIPWSSGCFKSKLLKVV